MKRVGTILAVCLTFSFLLTAAERPPAVTPVENYQPPALSHPDNWTMVLIPDTQAYVRKTLNHGTADLMFSWIAANVDHLRIQQVLHTGDLVDHNRSMLLTGPTILNGPEQWKVISKLFERLDGVVPYVITTGNHDYGELSAEDRSTELPKYFYPSRNSKLNNVLLQCAPNAYGEYTLESAAYEFTTPNQQKILIVTLGFSPTDATLQWAKRIFDDPKYKDHFGIVLTHSYMNAGGRIAHEGYIIENQDGNAGEAIFQKLVKVTPNIRLVLCGHASAPNDWSQCIRFQKSTNDAGKTVYEMLFDPQALAGGWGGNGGDGWIRLLEFSADMKTVKVRTFSPLFAISPSTWHLAWHTEPFNEFTFEYTD